MLLHCRDVPCHSIILLYLLFLFPWTQSPLTMYPSIVCCYRYSRFPDDRGIWSCSRFDGARQRVNLMVLVPPRARELVLPSNISLVDITSEAWAFTCSAQYAFPPVTLSWLKVSGRFISTLTTLKYIYLTL